MRIISGTARGTKLYTLEGNDTRPTLDRVKESLFSMIQPKIKDAVVLDLFSGSGALALEALSRGAQKAILCDCSPKAIEIIQKNIVKTHFENKTQVICKDYKQCLDIICQKVNFIFIDPPYKANIAVQAVKMIQTKNLLLPNGLMILETDDEERELDQIKKISGIEIKDFRAYGRVKLIFLGEKEG